MEPRRCWDVCRNEPGKRKHPEFAGLPVCRECFDLLGAAAWHLEGDWKSEGGSDKYCRFCAGSAPGGTSTLMHCGKPGCNKGFCTGYAAHIAMVGLPTVVRMFEKPEAVTVQQLNQQFTLATTLEAWCMSMANVH